MRPTLDFTPDAKAAWVHVHDQFESDIGPGGEFESVKDIGAKAAENAARLACSFHVFENGPQGRISAEHVSSAGQIVAWHLCEARRIFGAYEKPGEIADAKTLEHWLLSRVRESGNNCVRRTQALKSGPSRLRKKAALDRALDELIVRHRVRESYDGNSQCYEVNPKLLEGSE